MAAQANEDQDGPRPGGNASLEERLARLTWAIEKMNLAEYTALLRSPWRLVFVNFVAGAARGLGMAIGFTLLGALVLYVLQSTMVRNLPWIGQFIADIVKLVQLHLRP